MKKILDVEVINDIKKQKIFFGETSGIQRFDYYKYPRSKKLERQMRGAYWNPDEVSLKKDIQLYFTLPRSIRAIFESNISYQTLMDSGNNIGLDEALIPLVTSPEIEAMLKTQSYFELIHSLSYAHNLITVFPDPSKVYDSIAVNKHIKNRVNSEIDIYTKLKELQISNEDIVSLIQNRYKTIFNDGKNDSVSKKISKLFGETFEVIKTKLGGKKQLEEDKKTVLEALIRINALEGLKFYVSFLMTYKINDEFGGKIPGATKIIKLINFDEDLHVNVFQFIIEILRKEFDEGFTHLFKKGENGEESFFEQCAYKVYKEVYEDELDWAKYLFNFADATKEGEEDKAVNLYDEDEVKSLEDKGYSVGEPRVLPGLNEEVLDNFLKYYVNLRLTSIKLEPMFDKSKVNSEDSTINWFKIYKNINSEKTAAQETEILAYSIGQLNNDIEDTVFESNLFSANDFDIA